MRIAISFAAGAAVGAAAAHFLDPDSGARRRNQLKDKAGSKARSGAATAQTTAKQAANKAQGVAATVTPSMPGSGLKDPDDVTLARKVETEIFRPADAPKGGVSIDVEAGVAYLRGEVPTQEWIDRFGDEARKVAGIKGVKNLLHLPGTPAPAGEPRGAVTDPSS